MAAQPREPVAQHVARPRQPRQNRPFGATEFIRSFRWVEKVHLFGGSWGSTLSLVFAIRNPERVRGLLLRGIFLADDRVFRTLDGTAAAGPLCGQLAPTTRVTRLPGLFRTHDEATRVYRRLTPALTRPSTA